MEIPTSEMIRYADTETQPQVRRMWKTVFDDSDAYIDLYFRDKYRNHRTLIYLEGDRVTASLQMLPYCFTFCGNSIPVVYISGVCTLPEARKKGYMRRLLLRSFDEMAKNGIPLALLVPQEEGLLNLYGKYGFAQTFDAGKEELPSLKALLDKHRGNLKSAYKEFDDPLRREEMTVQKSFDDFRTIVEEARLFGFEAKRNLIGMARIIDATKLFSLFAARYDRLSFSVVVSDEGLKQNNALFTVCEGKSMKNGLSVRPSFSVDVRELVQLLLGYRTSRKEEPLRSIFPEKNPQMNRMLE